MLSFFVLHWKDHEKLARIIAPFVTHERFLRLKKHRQHVFFNRYEHLIHTASLSYRIAKFAGANVRVCALSWLLHDFHETRIKGYIHGLEAAENALFAGMRDILVLENIRAHMFPLGFGKIPLPKTREFIVLKIADFIAATVEITYGFLHGVMKFSFQFSQIKFRTTHRILERIAMEIQIPPTGRILAKGKG